VSDEMIDLMAGDMRLRRRLDAYAEDRLSPDLTATSRMRARVLAHAHRQAELVRADAALTIVPPTAWMPEERRRRHGVQRAAIALVAAAGLVGAMVGGAAAASGPGQTFYEARLWVETLTLPSDASARAIAQLGRLGDRLREAEDAARHGDAAAAAAALAAYERIVDQASEAAVGAGDPVAVAALEAGIGHNIDVLTALVASLPSQAAQAIAPVLERAIEHSGTVIEHVGGVGKPNPPAGGNSGAGGSEGGAPAPTAKPTKTPAQRPEATPKPTKAPDERPEATPKPTKTPRPTNEPGPRQAQDTAPQGDPAQGDPPQGNPPH
jgi:hypothetical protein